MKFNIGPLTDSQIAAGNNPEIAKDTELYAAEGIFSRLGIIEQTGDQTDDFTATLTPVSFGATGRDIHLQAVNGIKGAAGTPITCVIGVIYQDDVVGTMTATFDLPAWNGIQANILPIFTATDFVADDPADAAKLVKEVTSVNTVSNGLADGVNKFRIIASQPAAEFYAVGCLTAFSGEFPIPPSVPVGCGNDPQAYSREGTPEVQEVSASYKYFSSNESLARLNGHKVTLWVKTVKDGSVHWENRFYSGVISNTSPVDRNGQGDDEVVATMTGSYEIGAIGYAR